MNFAHKYMCQLSAIFAAIIIIKPERARARAHSRIKDTQFIH